jgi:manganese oxidase
MRTSGRRTLATLLALIALASCERSAARPPEATVEITTFAFTPRVLRVPPGTTVTWTNHDRILHSVTSGTAKTPGIPGVRPDEPAVPDGLFDGRLDGAGTTFRFRAGEAQRYTYYCAFHTGMAGEVIAER